MIDVVAVRERFPALRERPEALFFDNPAGTQVPHETIQCMVGYFERCSSNTGGAFVTSEATDRIIEEARQAMADFLAAASPREIVFGQNMTSLTYHLSHALRRVLRPGDEIVTTRLEHDANVSPWLALQDVGVKVRFADIHTEDMSLDLESLERAIGDRTRLVAVGYASNAFGTVNDVNRVTEMAHAAGAWVFVDAVHYGPHGPIDVQEIGCDFLACSSYKFFGPHLGILYGRYELLAQLPADHVRPAGDVPPDSWETGTQSHEALAGLLGALDYLRSLGGEGDSRTRLHRALSRIKRYERGLSERLIPAAQELPGVRVHGITNPATFDRRVPTLAFTVEGRQPDEIARALGARNIFSWSGDHYAFEPVRRIGLTSVNRIGLVHYNSVEEIDRFLEALDETIT